MFWKLKILSKKLFKIWAKSLFVCSFLERLAKVSISHLTKLKRQNNNFLRRLFTIISLNINFTSQAM